MVIIYDSVLTEPPSSISCFRDVTLFAKSFLSFENLIKCPNGTRSIYWSWVKRYGAHDFIDGLILDGEDQSGVHVGPSGQIKLKLLNEFNYIDLINKLKTI